MAADALREQRLEDALRHTEHCLQRHECWDAAREKERQSRVATLVRGREGQVRDIERERTRKAHTVARNRMEFDPAMPRPVQQAAPNDAMPWPLGEKAWKFAEDASRTWTVARDQKARSAVNGQLRVVTELAAPPLNLVGDRDSLIAKREARWRASSEMALRASARGRGSGAMHSSASASLSSTARTMMVDADARPATCAALARCDHAAARAIGQPGVTVGQLLSDGARSRLLSIPDAEAVLLLAQLSAWNAQQPILPGGGVPAISRRLVHLLDRSTHGQRAVANTAPPPSAQHAAAAIGVGSFGRPSSTAYQSASTSALGEHLRDLAADPHAARTSLAGVISQRASKGCPGGRADLDSASTGNPWDAQRPERTSFLVGKPTDGISPRRIVPNVVAETAPDPRIDTSKFKDTGYFYGSFTVGDSLVWINATVTRNG